VDHTVNAASQLSEEEVTSLAAQMAEVTLHSLEEADPFELFLELSTHEGMPILSNPEFRARWTLTGHTLSAGTLVWRKR
jgi:hypothetical protein